MIVMQFTIPIIKQYFDSHQQSPLIREIQAGCRIISYKSVADKLLALEKKGFIERQANKHRGILLRALEASMNGTSAPLSLGEAMRAGAWALQEPAAPSGAERRQEQAQADEIGSSTASS
jgi:SOS-response transcriptional repressor LexA